MATSTVRRPTRRYARGFSLIEVVTVTGVVSVLAAVAVPSLRDTIQRNRVAGEINSFVGDLRYARSEAIKRGLPVTICASANGTTCLGTNNWQQGWIVFADANGSGTVDGTADPIIRIRPGWTSGDTFGAAPSTTALTFSRYGFALNMTGVTMPLRTSPANTLTTRCVTISAVGRHAVVAPGTGTCT